jgi:hypothetical protein
MKTTLQKHVSYIVGQPTMAPTNAPTQYPTSESPTVSPTTPTRSPTHHQIIEHAESKLFPEEHLKTIVTVPTMFACMKRCMDDTLCVCILYIPAEKQCQVNKKKTAMCRPSKMEAHGDFNTWAKPTTAPTPAPTLSRIDWLVKRNAERNAKRKYPVGMSGFLSSPTVSPSYSPTRAPSQFPTPRHKIIVKKDVSGASLMDMLNVHSNLIVRINHRFVGLDPTPPPTSVPDDDDLAHGHYYRNSHRRRRRRKESPLWKMKLDELQHEDADTTGRRNPSSLSSETTSAIVSSTTVP